MTDHAARAREPPSSVKEEPERVRTADQDPEVDLPTQPDPDSEGDPPTQVDPGLSGDVQMQESRTSEDNIRMRRASPATAEMASEAEEPRLELVVRKRHVKRIFRRKRHGWTGRSMRSMRPDHLSLQALKLPRLSGARPMAIAIARASRCCERRHRPPQPQNPLRARGRGPGSSASDRRSAAGPTAAPQQPRRPVVRRFVAGPEGLVELASVEVWNETGPEPARRSHQSPESQEPRIWFCAPETLGAPQSPAAPWPAAGSRFWPLEAAAPGTQ